MCYSSDCGSEFWSVPLLLQGHAVCYLCFFMRIISMLFAFIFMLVISVLYLYFYAGNFNVIYLCFYAGNSSVISEVIAC